MLPRSCNGVRVVPAPEFLRLRNVYLAERLLSYRPSSRLSALSSCYDQLSSPSQYRGRRVLWTSNCSPPQGHHRTANQGRRPINWSSTAHQRRLDLIMATTTTQTRAASGHSHKGHHHHHDNLYLTSPNKNDAGVRITRIGLYCNLGMAVGKGIGGYYFNSQGT